MARRDNRHNYHNYHDYHSYHYSPRRGPVVTANRVVRLPVVVQLPRSVSFRSPPQFDRRTWHPDGTLGRPVAVRSADARLSLPPAETRKRQTKARVGFSDPTRVFLCVRRKERKEVLHAKGVAGSKGLRKPRRNMWSSVTCR